MDVFWQRAAAFGARAPTLQAHKPTADCASPSQPQTEGSPASRGACLCVKHAMPGQGRSNGWVEEAISRHVSPQDAPEQVGVHGLGVGSSLTK